MTSPNSFNGPILSKPIPKIVTYQHTIVPADELVRVFLEIMAGKYSGQLVINFSNGTPSGTVEWKQKTQTIVLP